MALGDVASFPDPGQASTGGMSWWDSIMKLAQQNASQAPASGLGAFLNAMGQQQPMMPMGHDPMQSNPLLAQMMGKSQGLNTMVLKMLAGLM